MHKIKIRVVSKYAGNNRYVGHLDSCTIGGTDSV